MKRGFGRSKQWKELFNVIKPQYYMDAKVMSRIVARKTQQEAYTRQMMLLTEDRGGGAGETLHLGSATLVSITFWWWWSLRVALIRMGMGS